MLLGDILVSNAARYPDKLGIIDTESRLTWRELNNRVNRLANAFFRLGLRKGDRIAIVCDNNHQYVELLFAAAKLGAIGVCLNWRLTGHQLVPMVNHCQPRAMVVQNTFITNVEPVSSQFSSVEHFIGSGKNHGYSLDFEQLITDSEAVEPVVEIAEDDPYCICFSSGTTGEPKAAAISHKNRMMNCIHISLWYGYNRDDVMLLDIPVFATGGQQFLFPYCFATCTTVIQRFSPDAFAETVERERVTTVGLGLTQYRMLRDFLDKSERKYDLSSISRIQSSGQYLSREQWMEVLAFFKTTRMGKGIGMTEAGVISCSIPEKLAAWLKPSASEKDKKRFESYGLAPMFGRLKVVDEDGRELPPNEVGEILYKGDNLIKGYWNQPEYNEKLFTRDGWFHTGDMGRLDEDGYLYLEGRKDDRIRSGTFNVYPIEIERVISVHEAVAQVAVFGVPDEKWVEAIHAAIILKEAHSLTEDEIKQYCRQYLASYQVPKEFHFVKGFPRDAYVGRPAKKVLREMFIPK